MKGNMVKHEKKILSLERRIHSTISSCFPIPMDDSFIIYPKNMVITYCPVITELQFYFAKLIILLFSTLFLFPCLSPYYA